MPKASSKPTPRRHIQSALQSLAEAYFAVAQAAAVPGDDDQARRLHAIASTLMQQHASLSAEAAIGRGAVRITPPPVDQHGQTRATAPLRQAG